MDLLEEARRQQGMEELPKRLRSALLHDSLKLLPHPDNPASKKRVDLHFRTVSHGPLHRHLVTIRCPDQAFYLDAIKGYLLRSKIEGLGGRYRDLPEGSFRECGVNVNTVLLQVSSDT